MQEKWKILEGGISRFGQAKCKETAPFVKNRFLGLWCVAVTEAMVDCLVKLFVPCE